MEERSGISEPAVTLHSDCPAEAKRYEGIKGPGPQDARTFYIHAAAILQDILAEVSAGED
jgi:hypothetical protein